MAVISGIAGAVNGSNTVRKWSINYTADTKAYNASNTLGATGRLAGNKDWTGSYEAYGHTPAVKAGASFSFVGSINGTLGCTGTAIVDQVVITWPIEDGGPISHVVSFSGNSALVKGSAAATDATVPSPPSAIGTKVQLGTLVATPVYTELLEVRSITLTFTASNQSYVSSTTAGVVKRTKGNIDATLAIEVYCDGGFAGLPDVNAVNAVRIFVNATLFWEILWIMFSENSGLEVDVEGAAVVGATINGALNMFTLIAAAQTAGSIKDPAGVSYLA